MPAKKQKDKRRLPFPWLCSNCVTRTVVPTVVDFTAEVKHDGVIHELHVPQIEVSQCRTCGNQVVTTKVDERVNDALRAKLHLLTPAQIRANIEKLGLTQQELAEWLDVAPETVSRWMTGALIQSSRTNKRLRMFFAFPAAREMLRRLDEEPQLGMEACLPSERGSVIRTNENDCGPGYDPPNGPGRHRLNANKRDELMHCLAKKDELSVGLLPQPSRRVAEPSTN